MGWGFDRDELVKLLRTDEEIRRLIGRIASAASNEDDRDNASERFSRKQDVGNGLEQTRTELARMMEKARRAIDERDKAVRQMEEARQALQSAQHAEEALQRQIRSLQQSLNDARVGLDAIKDDRDRAQAQGEAFKKKARQVEQVLEQRFAKGWQLYEDYQHLDDYFKNLLRGVFPRPGFEAFIVGLSQERSLKMIWDVTLEAVMNSHDEKDKEILQRLFQYSMDLFNRSRAEDIYAVEDVEVGDDYDMERHSLTKDSRAQGCLTAVFLRGYRNVRTDSIVCKSRVKI